MQKPLARMVTKNRVGERYLLATFMYCPFLIMDDISIFYLSRCVSWKILPEYRFLYALACSLSANHAQSHPISNSSHLSLSHKKCYKHRMHSCFDMILYAESRARRVIRPIDFFFSELQLTALHQIMNLLVSHCSYYNTDSELKHKSIDST